MNKETIGINAGVLWRLFSSENKNWEYNELKETTGLSDRDLNAAIGWLAREDKIQFHSNETEQKEFLYLELNLYIG